MGFLVLVFVLLLVGVLGDVLAFVDDLVWFDLVWLTYANGHIGLWNYL